MGGFGKLGQIKEGILMMNGLFKGISSGFTAAGNVLDKFTGKWISFQDAAFKSARSMAFGRDMSMKYTRALMDNTKALARQYGISHEEITKFQEEYAKNIGRNIILTQKQIEATAALGKITDEQTAADLINSFDKIGIGIERATANIGRMQERAKVLGISAAKATQTFRENIKAASMYSFKNGVADIEKMATRATSLRMDMNAILSASENFSNIEDAITNSAKIQMLGGGFGMQFSNPMGAMYESMADPAAFMERIVNTVSGKGTYNDKTGEVKFDPITMMQMKEMAKTLGVSIDKLTEPAMALTQNEKIDEELRRSGAYDKFSEKEREAIRNLSRNNVDEATGKHQITWLDENGEEQTAHIEELTREQLAIAQDRQMSEEGLYSDVQDIKDILQETLGRARGTTSTKENIAGLKEEFGAFIAQFQNLYMGMGSGILNGANFRPWDWTKWISGGPGNVDIGTHAKEGYGTLSDLLGETISALGFAKGGYTGDGDKHDVAGVVHRGEYVINKQTVENPKTAPLVSAISQAQETGNAPFMYDVGGMVGRKPSATGAALFGGLMSLMSGGGIGGAIGGALGAGLASKQHQIQMQQLEIMRKVPIAILMTLRAIYNEMPRAAGVESAMFAAEERTSTAIAKIESDNKGFTLSSNPNTKDYYEILGFTDKERNLQGEEFNKVLKAKHRELALKLHPDRGGDEEKFKEIQEAYKALSKGRPTPIASTTESLPGVKSRQESLKDSIKPHLDRFSEGAKKLWENVGEKAKGVWDDISGRASEMWGTLTGGFQNMFPSLSAKASKMFSFLGTKWNSMFGFLRNKFSFLTDMLGRGIATLKNSRLGQSISRGVGRLFSGAGKSKLLGKLGGGLGRLGRGLGGVGTLALSTVGMGSIGDYYDGGMLDVLDYANLGSRTGGMTRGLRGIGGFLKGGGGMALKGLGRIAGPVAGVLSAVEGIGMIGSSVSNYNAKKQEIMSSNMADWQKQQAIEEAQNERNSGIGKGVGTGVGAVAGGVLGSFLGPLGTAAGSWLGSKVGGFIGGTVGKVIGPVAKGIGSIAKGAWGAVKSVGKTVGSAVGSVITAPFKFIGSIFGGGKDDSGKYSGEGIDKVANILASIDGKIPGNTSNFFSIAESALKAKNLDAKEIKGAKNIALQKLNSPELKLQNVEVNSFSVKSDKIRENTDSFSSFMKVKPSTSSESNESKGGNSPKKADINLNISGTIKIDGGNKTTDLDISKLIDNPEFKRQITDLITQRLSTQGGGGKRAMESEHNNKTQQYATAGK